VNSSRFSRSAPPGCLRAFRATAMVPADILLDGHASPNSPSPEIEMQIEGADHIRVFFDLDCACGGKTFSVHGFKWQAGARYGTLFLSPLYLECRSCGRIDLVFDSDIHGSDAEQGVTSHRRAEGQRDTIKCSCQSATLQIRNSFEYSDDLFNHSCFTQMGREQDLFSWFDLIGLCERCNKWFSIASFECS